LSKTFFQMRGGIESYTYNMARFLHKLGNEIYIITSANNKKSHLEDNCNSFHVIEIKGGDDLFPGSWRLNTKIPFINIYYSFKVARIINKLCKKNKIDIIESPNWLYEGICSSFNIRIPLVVRLHGHKNIAEHYIFKTLPMSFRLKAIFAQERILLRNASFITSVSSNYADLIAKCLKIERSKITTIPTGVDTDFFKPNGENVPKKNYILYVGRIEEGKGVDVLCRSIPFVLNEFPEMEFIFIGADTSDYKQGNSYKDYLLRSILQKFGKNAKFLGPMTHEQLVDYYQNAIICVFPSLYEPLATTALEAMACGSPVIATKTGGFPEIINSNENGLLIEPQNHLDLAKAILHLLKDSQFRLEIGRAAVNTVKDKFSLERMANLTLETYKNVVKIKNRN